MPDVPLLLDVRANIEERPWDIRPEQVIEGEIESVGLLPDATVTGAAVVALLIRCGKDRYVVAQTTLKLARSAVAFLGATSIAQREADQ